MFTNKNKYKCVGIWFDLNINLEILFDIIDTMHKKREPLFSVLQGKEQKPMSLFLCFVFV